MSFEPGTPTLDQLLVDKVWRLVPVLQVGLWWITDNF
jgi:hypothetical protein